MAGTIAVVGYGPGVSNAVAERFGAEGFSVALVARNAGRLEAGVKALKARGIVAAAFRADASHPASIRETIQNIRAALGPISVLHWNAYGGGDVVDLLAADEAQARSVFDTAIVGLLAAVQDALPDLRSAGGAVLVTNGAFGELSPEVDALAVRLRAVGVALANAAKHKLVGLLAAQLKAEGVYVGEVMIAGAVKGTPFAAGRDGIEPSTVAEAFWNLYTARGETHARVS